MRSTATIDELARRTEVPSRTIAITTAAMVGLGLIEQHGDHYQNGEPAAAFLAGKPGLDLRPMLRFFESDQLSDMAKATVDSDGHWRAGPVVT